MCGRRLLRASVVAAAMFAPGKAGALPRFAARTGAPCALCHVNPSGAGARTEYGRNVFERAVLPWRPVDIGGLGDWLDAEVGSQVALGADVRWDYLYEPANGGPTTINSFFLMQADAYVSWQAGRLTGYVDVGALRSFEVFALFTLVERVNLYAKAGVFVPPYGLKLPNHRAYTRALVIGEPPVDRDAGFEIGIRPGRFALQAALFNGAFNIVSPADDEAKKGLAARAEVRLPGERLKVTLGGSLFYNVQKDARAARSGPFLMASLGRFTYLGEAAYAENQDASVPPEFRDTVPQLLTYQELSFLPARGWDIQLMLESADLDLQHRNNQATRVGLGFEWFPYPFIEIDFQIRRYFGSPSFVLGNGERIDGKWDLAVLVHTFY